MATVRQPFADLTNVRGAAAADKPSGGVSKAAAIPQPAEHAGPQGAAPTPDGSAAAPYSAAAAPFLCVQALEAAEAAGRRALEAEWEDVWALVAEVRAVGRTALRLGQTLAVRGRVLEEEIPAARARLLADYGVVAEEWALLRAEWARVGNAQRDVTDRWDAIAARGTPPPPPPRVTVGTNTPETPPPSLHPPGQARRVSIGWSVTRATQTEVSPVPMPGRPPGSGAAPPCLSPHFPVPAPLSPLRATGSPGPIGRSPPAASRAADPRAFPLGFDANSRSVSSHSPATGPPRPIVNLAGPWSPQMQRRSQTKKRALAEVSDAPLFPPPEGPPAHSPVPQPTAAQPRGPLAGAPATAADARWLRNRLPR